MAWYGGGHEFDKLGGCEINPFLVDSKTSALWFTEQLASGCELSVLQHAFIQDGSRKADRGNLSLSSQKDRPKHWLKAEYLCCMEVRSFPFGQLRSVILSLMERRLPCREEIVRRLAFQAFYHVGSIGPGEREDQCFLWKKDLYRNDFAQALIAVFEHLADVLTETPSDYEEAAFVGELCGFLSSWASTLKSVSRRLGLALKSWGEAVGVQATRSQEGKCTNDLRVKQIVLFRKALICFAQGPVDESDAINIIALGIKSTSICTTAQVQAGELCALESRCLELVCDCLPSVLEAVRLNPGALTVAVLETLPSCPTELHWQPIGDVPTACFEATTCDCSYAVNIVTGVILVQGFPPSTLPSSIRNHSVFKSAFGSSNFDVVYKDKVFETIYHIDGTMYEFFLDGKSLHVRETDNDSRLTSELLDAASIDQWGYDLPVRLRRMHSHWFYRELGILVFRGRYYARKKVSFLGRLRAQTGVRDVELRLHPVPTKLRDTGVLKLQRLADTFSVLLLRDKERGVTGVLEKIESRDYSHILRDPRGIVAVELPRLGLTFSLKAGQLWSNEYTGWSLCREQLLLGTLTGFHRYLVLEQASKGELFHSRLAIIVPTGRVVRDAVVGVNLHIDSSFDAKLSCQLFELHPRYRTLHAPDITGRLRLAALHAATTMNIQDDLFCRTGCERAIELVRQCWSSKPLTGKEADALENLRALAFGQFPSLALVCVFVRLCSERVEFLHTDFSRTEHVAPMLSDDGTNVEKCMYLVERRRLQGNGRSALSRAEALGLLGQSSGRGFASEFYQFDVSLAFDDYLKRVAEIENDFAQLLVPMRGVGPDESERPFPLSCPGNSNAVERQMYQELKLSWASYVSESTSSRLEISTQWKDRVARIGFSVTTLRKLIESMLTEVLERGPLSQRNCRSICISFFRSANIIPDVSLSDFTKILYDPDWTSILSPLLAPYSKNAVHELILIWHRLCVAEDKVHRLQSCSSSEAVKEVRATRSWDPHLYPSWLAFEVEQGIQIRPEQFAVAEHLLQCPGHVVQLNMGMGKTRVIIPMLVLHWSFHSSFENSRTAVTRVNILSSLLSEAYEFFHSTLTSSIGCVKLFLLPFCRDVSLDEARVEALERHLLLCQQEAGVVFVAPEHRLSLELKIIELYRSGHTKLSAALKRRCHQIQFRDVIDECDEMLHHRYQLIYATGSVQGLPDAAHRFVSSRFLLSCLLRRESVIKFIAHNGKVFLREADTDSEAFTGLRVNSKAITSHIRTQFCDIMARAVLEDPPYELDWIRDHPSQEKLHKAISDPIVCVTDLDLAIAEDHRHDVLALRALLAGDLLLNCLEKRHRVEYGIATASKKRIAIPFRGADNPSLRSEFAHPDCAIILTFLSYYYDGLNGSQLREAFATLLHLGPESRRRQYSDWLALSRHQMGPSDLAGLDSVEKIDLTNSVQFEKLLGYYRWNMKTIDFWLTQCVFPDEMQYFPQRLTATSWNLAENSPAGFVVGFSGTNDTHRILPLQIRQYFIDSRTEFNSDATRMIWKELMGTNGLMLDRILNNCLDVIVIQALNSSDGLLNAVRDRKQSLHAIIDSGALLAGKCMLSVAKSVLEILEGEEWVKGILFYYKDAWRIFSRSGEVQKKEVSPIAESETFAVFDEARCRGSDLKLRTDSVAMLTLGPKMCKDKLMQAAGRLRKLDGGQKLLFALPSEVANQIKIGDESESLGAKRVLDWALRNTADANVAGLLPWASQGIFHETSYGHPDLVVEDEQVSLKSMYENSFTPVPVIKAVRDREMCCVKRMTLDDRSRPLLSKPPLQQILKSVLAFGEDIHCIRGGTEEECERELELEREQEEEIEIQVPTMKPRHEQEWQVSRVFQVVEVSDLRIEASIESLSTFVGSKLEPKDLRLHDWMDKVFGTRNFFHSVLDRCSGEPRCLNEYLRLVNHAVYFPAKSQVLLVSEREADMLIEIGQTLDSDGGLKHNDCRRPYFFHVSMARAAADGTIKGLQGYHLALPRSSWLHVAPDLDKILTRLQLFAGEASYQTAGRKATLKEALSLTGGDILGANPNTLLSMRGNAHAYQHSDLEQTWKAVVREAEFRRILSNTT